MIKIGATMTTDFSKEKVLTEHERKLARATKGTAREFERLARPYVPMLTGALMKSSFTSPFDKGEVVYDTPYARNVYYRDNDTTNWTKDFHPNAMSHWGDYVKSKYIKDLTDVFKRYYKGNV
jgi:hypothetical protein